MIFQSYNPKSVLLFSLLAVSFGVERQDLIYLQHTAMAKCFILCHEMQLPEII